MPCGVSTFTQFPQESSIFRSNQLIQEVLKMTIVINILFVREPPKVILLNNLETVAISNGENKSKTRLEQKRFIKEKSERSFEILN